MFDQKFSVDVVDGGLQLEDTAALTKFLQIDMDGIKRERSTQL